MMTFTYSHSVISIVLLSPHLPSTYIMILMTATMMLSFLSYCSFLALLYLCFTILFSFSSDYNFPLALKLPPRENVLLTFDLTFQFSFPVFWLFSNTIFLVLCRNHCVFSTYINTLNHEHLFLSAKFFFEYIFRMKAHINKLNHSFVSK